jgi:hypothetical protein
MTLVRGTSAAGKTTGAREACKIAQFLTWAQGVPGPASVEVEDLFELLHHGVS